MPELPAYTVAAVAAPLLVVALELVVLRTGLFGTLRYWLTVGIVLGFQVPVDGWLTRPRATVVHYDPAAITGVRVASFPVEDFGFGFALVTLTVLSWRWHQRRLRWAPTGAAGAGATGAGATGAGGTGAAEPDHA